MKKVVRLTEEDLVNLIKGVINESFRKGELIDAMTLDIKNELELNGFLVEYQDFETFSELHIKGHETVVPWRPNVVKSITIEITMETMESDPMMIVYTHVTTDISGYERFINKVFSIDEGIDFLLRLKENEMVLGKMDQPINESFGNDDFIEVLSTEVHNELVDNGLNVIEGASATFPGRLWVVGHKAPLPDHPVTISDIRIDFDLSPYDDDSGPYLDMRIYFHGAANHEADKSFKIEKGIDFILKLKEEGKLPTIN